MKLMLEYSEAAQDDLQESYEWYEGKRKGLVEEFLQEAEQQLELVKENPESFSVYHEIFRCCNIIRFPFKIIYSAEENVIKVWAIYHHKRDPKKWIR
ncbi:MAG: type II toxin-antitoxin system RelE/ParE family toxin [Chitinophagales bacterium]|nr:type II toxin-antitoxin system RelE/ParE family toxin [Chitinophagales bacterium]